MEIKAVKEFKGNEGKFTIKKGCWYIALKDGRYHIKGKAYQALEDGIMSNEIDTPSDCRFWDMSDEFRPATKDEVNSLID